MLISPGTRQTLPTAVRFASSSPLNWYSDPDGVMTVLKTQTYKQGGNQAFSLGEVFERIFTELGTASPERQQQPGLVFRHVLEGQLKFTPEVTEEILGRLTRLQLITYSAGQESTAAITTAGTKAHERRMVDQGILNVSALDTLENGTAASQIVDTVPIAGDASLLGGQFYVSSMGYVGPVAVQTTQKPPEPERLDWRQLGGQTVAEALQDLHQEAAPVASPPKPPEEPCKAMVVYQPKKLAVDPRLEPYSAFVKDISYAESNGKYGAIVGREPEINELTQAMQGCLSKKVVLHGPASSGKTAIIRGAADKLPGARIWSVDLSGVVAGTKYRGEMEEKFRNFLEFAITQPDIILHVPNAHTLVRGGSSEDGMNLGTILAPYLEEPNMRMILEMSDTGYRRVFERDESLQAQFQPVAVQNATADELLQVIQSFCPQLEKHFDLRPISQKLIVDTIRMTRDNVRNKPLIPVLKQVLDRAGTAARGGRMTMKHVAEAVGKVAGNIPLAQLTESDKDSLLRLEDTLSKRVVGHDDAKKKIAEAIRHRRSGLFPKKGPIGVFMLDGPTGVGKTELAKALSEWISGKPDSDDHLIRINFNEYAKGIGSTRVGGAPPGYAGYEQGGQLTEQIFRKPNSVILLDEIEKADDETRNMLLTLMDEGVAVDGQGRTIDARNCVIIMTTNAGARDREQFDKDSETRGVFGLHMKSEETLAEERRAKRQDIMEDALQDNFTPEFRNRVDDILILDDLSAKEQEQVINLHLDKLLGHLKSQNFDVDVDDDVRQFLVAQQFTKSTRKAGRKVKDILKKQLENPLANFKIQNDLNHGARLKVRMNEAKTGVVVSKDAGFDRVS